MNRFTLKKQFVISSPKTRTITYNHAVHGPHMAYGGPAQDIFENLFRDFSAFQVVVCGNGYTHALGQFVCNVLGNSISKQKYGLSCFFPPYKIYKALHYWGNNYRIFHKDFLLYNLVQSCKWFKFIPIHKE